MERTNSVKSGSFTSLLFKTVRGLVTWWTFLYKKLISVTSELHNQLPFCHSAILRCHIGHFIYPIIHPMHLGTLLTVAPFNHIWYSSYSLSPFQGKSLMTLLLIFEFLRSSFNWSGIIFYPNCTNACDFTWTTCIYNHQMHVFCKVTNCYMSCTWVAHNGGYGQCLLHR